MDYPLKLAPASQCTGLEKRRILSPKNIPEYPELFNTELETTILFRIKNNFVTPDENCGLILVA
jgi:hypothetical protein